MDKSRRCSVTDDPTETCVTVSICPRPFIASEIEIEINQIFKSLSVKTDNENCKHIYFFSKFAAKTTSCKFCAATVMFPLICIFRVFYFGRGKDLTLPCYIKSSSAN